jgi:hypothetical protein
MEEFIREHGMTDPLAVYDHVKTYDDLLETNIAFLEGRMARTLYCYGLMEETTPLIEKLKRLHQEKKLFTTEGQPATLKYDTWVTPEGKPQGNWWVSTEQKSYLSGFTLDASEFRKTLEAIASKHPKFYFQIYDFTERESFTNFDEKFKMLGKQGIVKVTRVITYTDISKRETTPWEYYTNCRPLNHQSEPCFDDHPNIYKLFKKGGYFDILLDEYGVGSVEDLLLE